MVPELYIVTDRHATLGRPLPIVLEQALAALRDPVFAGDPPRVAVQLREKDLPSCALIRLAEELRAVTARARVPLFVNGRADVALAVGADGVHLGWRSLAAADVTARFPMLRLAISVHSVEEIERAPVTPDFVLFGPVHATPSKTGLMNAKGLQCLTVATATGVPLVAIGGLDASNVSGAFESGASGVACVRAVMCQTDPARAVKQLLVSARKRP